MVSANLEISEESSRQFWTEKETGQPEYKRMRARIGGIHCSLCTGTIEQALGDRKGVGHIDIHKFFGRTSRIISGYDTKCGAADSS